jgi:spermidine synthase
MLYYVLYFVSGFFGLALQVIWQRQLAIITGGTMYSIACIISVWMAGLAIGSFAGGKLARSGKNLGALFCITQILTGIYVLASPALFWVADAFDARTFSLQEHAVGLSIALRALLLLVVLIIPIGLIGAGFPIISGLLGKRRIALLYYVNAFGAAAGALLVSFFFMEKIGVRWSVAALSCALIIINATALFFAKNSTPSAQPQSQKPFQEKETFGKRAPSHDLKKILLRMVPVFFFLSGFTSLSYEFLYNRIILFIFKESSYFSFAIILALFILGISGGSFVYALMKRKIISLHSRLVWFSLIECGIGAWHVIMPALSVFIFTAQWVIDPNGIPGHYFLGTVLYRTSIAALLMLPPVVGFGFLYPLVVELYVDLKGNNTGDAVGRIGFFNIAGSTVGPVLTVFVLIAVFQVGGALRLMSLLNIIIALSILFFMLFCKEFSYFRIWSAAIAAAPLLFLWISFRTPVSFDLFQYLARGSESTKLLFYRENAFSTVAVTKDETGVDMLSINCISEVPTDYNAIRTFRLLAYLPFMATSRTQSVLTIAFGGGITFGSACQVLGVRDITCSEIDKDVLDAAGYFSGFNHNVIATHRKDVVIEDGRRFIDKSGNKYDVIICDMTHPSLSDSWVLFTKEFYSACAKKLTAGGVMVQWVPIHGLPLSDYKVILRTFCAGFKEVSLFYVNNYTILLGSASPISLSQEAINTLAENPVVAGDLKSVHLDSLKDITRMELMKTSDVLKFAGPGETASDDYSPVQFSQKRLTGVDSSQMNICESFGDYVAQSPSRDSPTADYQLATLKLRGYIYRKDLLGLLVYFACEQKALTEKGAFDDELTKTLTSEDVKQMLVVYFFKQNGLERLVADSTDDHVKALEVLGSVVFTSGDESDFIKGARLYQEKSYDAALAVLIKLYQRRPYSSVESLINAAMNKPAKN